MKKLFTLVMALVAVTAVNAKKVTFNFADPQSLGIAAPAASQATNLTDSTIVFEGVTMTCTNGGTATRIWNSNGNYDLRIYNNGTLTFTTDEDITAAAFDGTAVNFSDFQGTTWIAEEAVKSVTFHATATCKISSIEFTIGEAPEQWDPDTVSVTEARALIDASDKHDHYVIGVVASELTDEYSKGLVTFWLSDVEQPADTLQAYEAAQPDGSKWESLEDAQRAIHLGDTVLMYAGSLKLYAEKNFYEMTSCKLVEILGANPDAPEPEPEPELPEGVISCDSALVLAAAIADPTEVKGTVEGPAVVVRGYVAYKYDAKDGKQSAWIGDTKGKSTLQGSYLQITSAVAVNDYVQLSGTLAKYLREGKDGKPNEVVIEVINGTMYKVSELGIEEVVMTEKAQKVIVDGVVYIVRDNKMFNIHGAQVR